MEQAEQIVRDSRGTEHLSGYQARDYEVVDYQMSELPGTRLFFRGPISSQLAAGNYFTCIGAAQTLGCFCPDPYPSLLEQELGIEALNLGYGGAGPEFFLRHPELIDYINRGKFAVVQVMSGRSQSNSLFDSGGLEYLVRRSDGARIGANAAYTELINGSPLLQGLPPRRVGRFLARTLNRPRLQKVVEETRQNWVKCFKELLGAIRVPTVLFWFSKRQPNYTADPRTVNGLFGEFPQLVTAQMVEAIRSLGPAYVECVTRRGSPQPLVSRFTGEPVTVSPANDRPDLGKVVWKENLYYPSPEMHQDGALSLSPVCRRLLKAGKN